MSFTRFFTSAARTLSSTIAASVKQTQHKFHTRAEPFSAGCIVQATANQSANNRLDLAKAIPATLQNKDCLILIAEPIAIGSPDPSHDNMRHVLKDTHLAACIGKPNQDLLTIEPDSVMSKVMGDIVTKKDKRDIVTKAYGKLAKQDFKTKAYYQSLDGLERFMYKNPQGELYFIFIKLDAFTTDPAGYKQEVATKIAAIKENDNVYDRQFNSCVHAVLKIFGTDRVSPNIVTQSAAQDVVATQLKNKPDFIADFINAADRLRLLEKLLERGQRAEHKLLASDPLLPSPRFTR